MNRNLIFSQPDSTDNPKINFNQTEQSSQRVSRELTKLVIGILSFLFIFWIVFLALANIYCIGKYSCAAVDIAFWSLPVFLLFVGVMFTLSFFVYMLEISKNLPYLHMLGTRVSRDQLDKFSPEVISVALQVAKSLATTGLDTYSPSIQSPKEVTHGKIDEIVEDTTGLLLRGDSMQDIQKSIQTNKHL